MPPEEIMKKLKKIDKEYQKLSLTKLISRATVGLLTFPIHLFLMGNLFLSSYI